jgi:type II restriction enzyme
VRSQHSKKSSTCSRGWPLDVLIAVRSLNKTAFSNEDAYTLEPHLKKLHPRNRHIRDKIRQQLQVLRDLGFLTHLAHGEWHLK